MEKRKQRRSQRRSGNGESSQQLLSFYLLRRSMNALHCANSLVKIKLLITKLIWLPFKVGGREIHRWRQVEVFGTQRACVCPSL